MVSAEEQALVATDPAMSGSATVDPSTWNQRSRDFLSYWQDRRPGPGILPARRHIDPAELKPFLPNVWLLDIQHAPFRARYRVIGTHLVDITGRDLTGLWIDEIGADAAARIYPSLQRVAELRAPVHFRGQAFYNNADRVRIVEYVLLPLAANGHDVDMVLGHSVYASALSAGA